MPGSGVKDFYKKYSNFTPKLHPLWMVGHEIYNFFVSLPDTWYTPNLVKISPVVLDKKMLTHDDGRKPIAIGHLSDSGDLR